MNTRVRPRSSLALLAFLLGVAPVAAEPPEWQPVLARSFKGDVKDIGVTSLVVYRNPGCVFLQVEGKGDGKGVYCSAPGGTAFKRVAETWEEVCAHAAKSHDSKHRFEVTGAGIKESLDGGATWSKPIPLPRDFVTTADTWVQHDATNDVLYLMKKGSDLYKLARRK